MTDYANASPQFVFDKIARHLIDQNEKATSKGICVCYDEKTERRCAAACLINLDYYRENGNMGLGTLLSILNLNNDRYQLVTDLQACHDNNKPSKWPPKLRAIAKRHSLEIPDFLKEN